MKKSKLLHSIGITICTLGGVVTIGTLGLGAKLGLPVVAAGFSFILAGWALTKYGRPTLTAHLIITSVLAFGYTLLVLNYIKSTVIRVKAISKARELAIICGAEGYASLPGYRWWTRTVEMPTSNILITSTGFDNISTNIIVVDEKGNEQSSYNHDYGQRFCAGPLSVIELNLNHQGQETDWTFSKSVSETIIQLCTKKRLKLP